MSGLPGTGKSTLSQYIAKRYNALYLRIDTVEQALRDLCDFDVKGEGYRLSYRIAGDNLKLGLSVVADSCNPWNLTRKEWEKVAEDSDANFINIEVVCLDRDEHRKRIETRISEVENLKLPSWEDVLNRDYHPWTTQRITIDTANKSIEMSLKELDNKFSIILNREFRL